MGGLVVVEQAADARNGVYFLPETVFLQRKISGDSVNNNEVVTYDALKSDRSITKQWWRAAGDSCRTTESSLLASRIHYMKDEIDK